MVISFHNLFLHILLIVCDYLANTGHLLLGEAEAGQVLPAAGASTTDHSAAAAAVAAAVQMEAIACSAAVVRHDVQSAVVVIAGAAVIVVVVVQGHRSAETGGTIRRRVTGGENGSRIGRGQVVEICGGML